MKISRQPVCGGADISVPSDIFMVMEYSSDPEAGIDGDTFDLLFKVHSTSLEDADTELAEYLAEHPEDEEGNPYSGIYVSEYNSYFDDPELPVFDSIAEGFAYNPEEDLELDDYISTATYIDVDGIFTGEPGTECSDDDFISYWQANKDSDPVLVDYQGDFDAWYSDTVSHMQPVESEVEADVVAGDDLVPVTEPLDEDPDAVYASDYILLDSKLVKDSDGFYTDYTWYQDSADGMYVFVFGDRDLYYPEESEFDFTTYDYDEAADWFNSYDGIYEE